MMTITRTSNLEPYSILSTHATLQLMKSRLNRELYTDGRDCLKGMIASIKEHAKKYPKDVYIYSEIGNSDYNGWCFNVGDGDPVYLEEYRRDPIAVNWNSFLATKYSYSLANAIKKAKFIKKDIHIHPMHYPCVHDYDIKTMDLDRKYFVSHLIEVINL